MPLNGLFFRLGFRRVAHGIEVSAPVLPPSAARYVLDRAEVALALIGQRDPVRLARLRRDTPRVLLGARRVGDACYDAASDLVVLNLEVVGRRETSPTQLALLIVHEAAHARIERTGIRYTPECRVRIERVCRRAELAFAERLPEPDRSWYVEQCRRALVEPPGDYSDEALIEWEAAESIRSGLPKWLVSLLRRLSLRALVRRRGQSGV